MPNAFKGVAANGMGTVDASSRAILGRPHQGHWRRKDRRPRDRRCLARPAIVLLFSVPSGL